jgi:hypothetical protein
MAIRPTYDCTVLLGGSRDNSVFVSGITAVEMYVLQAIHGANESGTNPITNVVPTGKGVERTDEQERARIGARYNAPGQFGGIAILNARYGVGNKLPTEYAAPEAVDPTDPPLRREPEKTFELKPEGPISSVPKPKTQPIPDPPEAQPPTTPYPEPEKPEEEEPPDEEPPPASKPAARGRRGSMLD